MAEAEFDMAACLARVRENDDEAARLLVARLYPLVIKIVRAHRPKRVDEEDLAQVVYMKVFSRLDQFSGTVPLDHWVSRIAVNTCLNELRSEKNRRELRWADLSEVESEWLETAIHDPSEATPGELYGVRELVGKLLDTLKPEDRLVLTLLDLEQRSVAEITQATGWNASLVKVRAFRARRKLRKQLAKMSGQERCDH